MNSYLVATIEEISGEMEDLMKKIPLPKPWALAVKKARRPEATQEDKDESYRVFYEHMVSLYKETISRKLTDAEVLEAEEADAILSKVLPWYPSKAKRALEEHTYALETEKLGEDQFIKDNFKMQMGLALVSSMNNTYYSHELEKLDRKAEQLKDLMEALDGLWASVPEEEKIWKATASTQNLSSKLPELRERYGEAGYRFLKEGDLDHPWDIPLVLNLHTVQTIGTDPFRTEEQERYVQVALANLDYYGILGKVVPRESNCPQVQDL